jgi:UDPglucose--hexose-1-phosphate uridylyltransferase
MSMANSPLDLQASVHRRFNPLTGQWVLVSPHRTARPWQGQVETVAAPQAPAHDPSCYLCPGNGRAGGVLNPDYKGTFVFDNDFAALRPDTVAAQHESGAGLFCAQSEAGLCRVICYTPRHDLSLGGMEVADIRRIVDTWADQTLELGARPDIQAVSLFENRGAMMGASSPHPHGQVWANQCVPDEVAREGACQQAHLQQHGHCLLCATAAAEAAAGERVVVSNAHFMAVVPFWAVWPFETLLLPRFHVASVPGLDSAQRDALADLLRQLVRRYDALFQAPFPYTMGLHQQPTDGQAHPGWHLHGHFYPPLLRSATVRKFMVGYELLAGAQRDITPETAAQRLRDAVA